MSNSDEGQFVERRKSEETIASNLRDELSAFGKTLVAMQAQVHTHGESLKHVLLVLSGTDGRGGMLRVLTLLEKKAEDEEKAAAVKTQENLQQPQIKWSERTFWVGVIPLLLMAEYFLLKAAPKILSCVGG